MTQHQLTINSDGLALEAVLHLPSSLGKAPAVTVCHPHPRYGGNMNSGIVVGLSEALRASGIAALRFNHRGVGGSEGNFAVGVDWALADAWAAVDALSLDDRIDATRVGIAGYSFGASVALLASLESDTILAMATIACPASVFKEFGARELLVPKLFVLGDQDHDFPVDQFRFLAQRYSEPKQVSVLSGADHFFRGHETVLGEIASAFFTRWLASSTLRD
ncbi:alpha/beta hydrolase [Dehalococcoidia bacterium]|nr:alpha/beta hydrolase [Dehalococcoidia bacterium]